MAFIFNVLVGVISLYSLLCVVRIILTWIPGANYSSFGRFLSNICDPFLNVFSRIKVLHIGPLDLSPLLALATLSMASFIMQTLSRGGRITIAGILILVIQMAWNIVSTLLLYLIIFVVVRLVIHLMGTDRNSSLWYQIDASLNPFVYSISKFFSAGKPVAYKTALIIALVALIVLRFGGGIVIGGIINMCALIPF